MLQRSSPPTVLLVDDDPASVHTVAAALRWSGYEVLCAETPMAALVTALYRESRIDLLIADIHLPGMSGQELAEELSRFHPETRTLFISAPADAEGCAGTGRPVLLKPFVPGTLLTMVSELIDQRNGPHHTPSFPAVAVAVSGAR